MSGNKTIAAKEDGLKQKHIPVSNQVYGRENLSDRVRSRVPECLAVASLGTT
jgi:pimeloyl-CoA synthetase